MQDTTTPRWAGSRSRIRLCPQPGNPGSLNRYSYANNNALPYTDPSGHRVIEDNFGVYGCNSPSGVGRIVDIAHT